jgi:hypothetical protein
MQEKIKKNKEELDKLIAEERMIKSNIQELKSLIEQKKNKSESIRILKEEEARLLAELES